MFKGHLSRKIDSFLFLIPFLANRHISKTSILASNLPKFLKMNLSRSGIDEIKTKLYTGIIYMCIKNYLLTYFLLASCEWRNIMLICIYELPFNFLEEKGSLYMLDFENKSAQIKGLSNLHTVIKQGLDNKIERREKLCLSLSLSLSLCKGPFHFPPPISDALSLSLSLSLYKTYTEAESMCLI